MRYFTNLLLTLCLTSIFSIGAFAAHHEEGTASVRASAVVVEALVVAIDLENREFSLEMPQGAIVTMKAGPVMDMKRLEELSVGDIHKQTELSQSSLSQHLGSLRDAGLVKTRRESQSIYYSLDGEESIQIIEALHKIYC